MKKILMLFLILVLSVSQLISCNDKENSPSDSGNNNDNLKFAVIGDSQLLPNSNHFSSVNLKTTLTSISKMNVDLIMYVGDIVDYGSQDVYTYYKNIENEIFQENKPDFLYIMGNHETYAKAGEETTIGQSIALFEENFNQKKNVHKVIQGYDFVGISTDSNTLNGDYNAETIEWAKTTLKEINDDNPSKPIFVATHSAPTDTVTGSSAELGMSNSQLNDLFKDYPQVVLFSGHSHRPLANPLSIYQKDYTVLNTQAVAYTHLGGTEGVIQPGSSDFNYPDGYKDYGFGVICEVDKETNKTTISRMNFTTNKKLNYDFVIESYDKENFIYNDSRITNDEKPIFIDNNIEVEKDINSTTKFSVYLKFKPASHKDSVEYYLITASDGQESKNYKVYTDYFVGKESMAKNCELYVPGFLQSKNYELTIKAVSPFGTVSEQSLKVNI